jgi:hypothetical protein
MMDVNVCVPLSPVTNLILIIIIIIIIIIIVTGLLAETLKAQ